MVIFVIKIIAILMYGSLQAYCGGVLRGSIGKWVSGFCKNFNCFPMPTSFWYGVALFAVLTAVEVVMSLEVYGVVIESDSLEVSRFINAPVDDSHKYVCS